MLILRIPHFTDHEHILEALAEYENTHEASRRLNLAQVETDFKTYIQNHPEPNDSLFEITSTKYYLFESSIIGENPVHPQSRKVIGCSVVCIFSSNGELGKPNVYIGYEIRPTKRNEGYEATILRLTLDTARLQSSDIYFALITCDRDNHEMRKIMEDNKNPTGIFDGEFIRDGKQFLRYKFDLREHQISHL